jgi:hypothetical protein
VAIFNIDDAKRRNRAAGLHWFSPDTLRFFSSRISRRVWSVPDGCLFVTSEQCRFSAGYPRLYSVRYCADNGEVSTVGEFQQYETLKQAHGAATREQSRRRAEAPCAA